MKPWTCAQVTIVHKKGLVFGSKDSVTWCSGQLHLQSKRGKFWKSDECIQTGNRDLACFPYSEISLLSFHHVGSCFRVETWLCAQWEDGRKEYCIWRCGLWIEVSLDWLDRCQEAGNQLHWFFFFFFKSHNYASFLLYSLLLPDAKSLDLGQFISPFMDKRLSFHVSEACICFLENHAIRYLLTWHEIAFL